MNVTMTIPILYKSKDMIAINKPAGLVVHGDGRTEEKTLVDWIIEKYPDAKEVGEPIALTSGEAIHRPGIVHRLDRDTSGVMLVALTQEGFNHLKRQFQDRSLEKKYHAFVYGIMSEDDGVIDRPIARSRKDFRLWSAQRGGRGEARSAVTHYKVLNRIEFKDDAPLADGATFIEASPKTGRTHQIRVHFKALNHPVVGDTLYAPKREPILGFKRLALHAREITFENMENEEITIQAPYPEDFSLALSKVV
jgi:23S rRNA pseudouridine1911/1915/1917 synthase